MGDRLGRVGDLLGALQLIGIDATTVSTTSQEDFERVRPELGERLGRRLHPVTAIDRAPGLSRLALAGICHRRPPSLASVVVGCRVVSRARSAPALALARAASVML